MPINPPPAIVNIEHRMSEAEVTAGYRRKGFNLQFISAGIVRTTGLIASGEVLAPASLP